MGVSAFDVGLFDEDFFDSVNSEEQVLTTTSNNVLTSTSFTDSLSVVEFNKFLINIVLSNTIGLGEDYSVLVNSLVLDSLSLVESLNASLVTHAFQTLINDSLSLTESNNQIVGVELNEGVVLNDSLIEELEFVLSDSVGVVDELNTNLLLLLSLLDSVSLSDSQKILIKKVLSGVCSFSDNIVKFVTTNLTTNLVFSDSLKSGIVQVIRLLESLSLTDSVMSEFFKILNNKPHVWFVKDNKPNNVLKVLKPNVFGENINKPDLLNVRIEKPKLNKVE